VPLIRITAGLPCPFDRRREEPLADALGAVHARFLSLHPRDRSARSRRERTEHPFVSYKWSIVSTPHRSEQDFARLTDEALGTVMAPFPSWGPARKKGQDRKYFYKSLLLICSSLLSRQMCARGELSPAWRTQRRPRASERARARTLTYSAVGERTRARALLRASERCRRYTHARPPLRRVRQPPCTSAKREPTGGPAGVAAGRRTNTIAVTRRRPSPTSPSREYRGHRRKGPPATVGRRAVRRPACPAGQRRAAERCGAAVRGGGSRGQQ